MKKILMLLMAFLLVGCQQPKKDEEVKKVEAEKQEEQVKKDQELKKTLATILEQKDDSWKEYVVHDGTYVVDSNCDDNRESFPFQSDARGLDGKTYDEIVEKLGKPQWKFGSKSINYEWDIAGGMSLTIQFEEKDGKMIANSSKLYNNGAKAFFHSSSENCDSKKKEDIPESKIENIQKGLFFKDVVNLIGKPQWECGSGVKFFEWRLSKDKRLLISFEPASYKEYTTHKDRVDHRKVFKIFVY